MTKLYFRRVLRWLLDAPTYRTKAGRSKLNEMTLNKVSLSGRDHLVIDLWCKSNAKEPPVRITLRPNDARRLQTAIGVELGDYADVPRMSRATRKRIAQLPTKKEKE